MGYCTTGEVLKMIKEDMVNSIIGDEYIEDADEKQQKITALCEDAISDACAEMTGTLPSGTRYHSRRHHRSSTSSRRILLYITLCRVQE